MSRKVECMSGEKFKNQLDLAACGQKVSAELKGACTVTWRQWGAVKGISAAEQREEPFIKVHSGSQMTLRGCYFSQVYDKIVVMCMESEIYLQIVQWGKVCVWRERADMAKCQQFLIPGREYTSIPCTILLFIKIGEKGWERQTSEGGTGWGSDVVRA